MLTAAALWILLVRALLPPYELSYLGLVPQNQLIIFALEQSPPWAYTCSIELDLTSGFMAVSKLKWLHYGQNYYQKCCHLKEASDK